MRQTIRLTESELREMVEMSINEALEDEGFFGNIGRGLKSAFGGDAQMIGQGAQRAAQSVGRGAQRAAQAVGRGAQRAAQAVGQGAQAAGRAVQRGAQNVATGAAKRYNDMKVGYRSGQQNDQLNKIKTTIQGMLDNGTLGKGSTAKAAQNFLATLDQAIRNNDDAARNPRGIKANRFM
jgi:hypothetical protein